MKKAIKYTFYTFLAIFFIAIVIRIMAFDSSKVLSDIIPTDNMKEAYANGSEVLTHELIQNIADDGNSRGYALVYLPEKGELQITMKYNLSIIKKASLTDGYEFQFKLYNTETEEEYKAVSYVREIQNNYGYARAVFEGVYFSETADVEIVMCNKDFTEDYSCYKVHASKQEFEPYEFTKEDIALLGN